MTLQTIWFCVVALFLVGYLFLEGFDFGVGMLLPVLSRDETERRVMVNTIGPVWDGNEVWLIVAGGAMFAAFPGWYASLFSGLYLGLLLVLLALILRGVAFEYRGKVDSVRWRRNWDLAIMFGSWVPPIGVGILLASTVLGLPLNEQGNRVGSPFVFLTWQALLGAAAIVGFCLLHGAAYVTLKTEGDLRERARGLALRSLPFALAPLVAFLLVVQFSVGEAWTWVPLVIALVAALVAWWRLALDRDGQAFAALAVAVVGAGVTLFGALYPDVLPSTIDSANSLRVDTVSSSPYTLTVMTWVAAFGAPAVLVYQGWTYWVFRKRLSTRHIPPVQVP